MNFLKRVRLYQWAWLHFKLALGIGWSTGILFVTPESIASTTSSTNVQVWTYGTMFGAVISIVGLLMSCSQHIKVKDQGLRIELMGLILFAGGPLQYLILQLTFLQAEFDTRYALTWFAYSMLSVVATRLIIILTAIRKGNGDKPRTNL